MFRSPCHHLITLPPGGSAGFNAGTQMLTSPALREGRRRACEFPGRERCSAYYSIDTGLPALSDFPSADPTSTFAGPALFIAGGRSAYLAAEHHPAVRRLFPRAEIAVLDDAGHWLHAEQPEKFFDLVAPFLDRHSG